MFADFYSSSCSITSHLGNNYGLPIGFLAGSHSNASQATMLIPKSLSISNPSKFLPILQGSVYKHSFISLGTGDTMMSKINWIFAITALFFILNEQIVN